MSPSSRLSNGHTNGFSNGVSPSDVSLGGPSSESVQDTRAVSLYPSSSIDREEFIRLTLQALKDVGYQQAADALEKESGYTLESPTITSLRDNVLNGRWKAAEGLLDSVQLPGSILPDIKFLIRQQKFLELLESQDTKKALSVLRNELAPLNHNPERLHLLSSFMMCTSPEDLRNRAVWSGSSGDSRSRLLAELQAHIPSSIMVPQRRMQELLEQAKAYQRLSCPYHTHDVPISLYRNHVCDKTAFPRNNTRVLTGHEDEVWVVEFSHDGKYLASGGQDKTVIIWRMQGDFGADKVLKGHSHGVAALTWSPDDQVLVTSAEDCIKIWDTTSGECKATLAGQHDRTVGTLAWMPDGTSFVSGGMDHKLIFWSREGEPNLTWHVPPTRIVSLAISPDGHRLVAVGEADVQDTSLHPQTPAAYTRTRRILIYNIAEQKEERCIEQAAEMSSVTISDDSRYALINQSPDEVILWDLEHGRPVRRFVGQVQGSQVIKSCFGGERRTFIASGSEDSNVYLWNRESGDLLEVLGGHGPGSVNAVAWNYAQPSMFASAGDDHTVRLWEAGAVSGHGAVVSI